jgi:hypothetical protein
LKNRSSLTLTQRCQEHDLAVGKFQRVVMRRQTPLRFDTTPMSSEVHGNGLGTKAKPLWLTPGGFAVIDVHDFRNSSGSFAR